MSFTERSNLKMGERAPLIENPVIWTRSYEHPYKNSDFSQRTRRKERFQWMVFLGVTAISLLLLLATVGFVVRNPDKRAPTTPAVPAVTPTPVAPANPAAPGVVQFSTTEGATNTTTTTTTPQPPTSPPSVAP